MADPNAQQSHNQHHLHQRTAQHQQLISGAGVPHLLMDPQVIVAGPSPMHPPHQFQPQPYGVFDSFWQQQIHEIRNGAHDFKVHQLPLARIKKVMKTDEEVKMISAEAPILFAKGCDIFITELTMRAWLHAEECKRRTLQRSDIANAIKKVDMFDFLIDIVPREEKVAVKTEKIEYQDHQSPYYMGMPQSGHQFNTSLPTDHKIIVDPIAALHEQQQQLQYMQRMESQHQQPTLLPPITPVAGQQASPYRTQNRPQYAPVPANVSASHPSIRQATQEHPYYQQHSQELHHHHQTSSQHQLQHRQSEHNPVQVKYEMEPPIGRPPVEWYPQANNSHTSSGLQSSQGGYVQGGSHVSSGSHGYGQPLGNQSSHDYNHDSTGMHLSRHDEGYVRDDGVQRN